MSDRVMYCLECKAVLGVEVSGYLDGRPYHPKGGESTRPCFGPVIDLVAERERLTTEVVSLYKILAQIRRALVAERE